MIKTLKIIIIQFWSEKLPVYFSFNLLTNAQLVEIPRYIVQRWRQHGEDLGGHLHLSALEIRVGRGGCVKFMDNFSSSK